MKTFTAQATAAKNQRWSELVYLLELTLWRDKFGAAPVSTVLRMSDRTRTELSQTWLPLVQDWGSIGDALEKVEPGGTLGALDVTLINSIRVDTPGFSVARFTDMVRAELNGGVNTWDIAFADVKLYLLFKGGTAGDEVPLFRLQAEEVTDVTEATCTLRMTGVELALEDMDDLYRVDTNDFPLADPDAVGKPVPLLFGVQSEVPGLGLIAGIVHALRIDIPDTAQGTVAGAIPVSDPELLARMPKSGTLQIDDEQFTYVGLDPVGVQFTGVFAAANGTTRAAHNRGSRVFQVLSQFVYAFGANPGIHKTRQVLRVKSNGALVDPGSYTLDHDAVDIRTGRRLVVAKFTVLPIIRKQVQLVLDDRIEVSDKLIIDDAILVGDDISVPENIAVSTPLIPPVGGVGGFEETRIEFPLTATPVRIDVPFNPRGLNRPQDPPQVTRIAVTRVFDFPALPADGAAVTRVVWEVGLDNFGGDPGYLTGAGVTALTGWDLYAYVAVSGQLLTNGLGAQLLFDEQLFPQPPGFGQVSPYPFNGAPTIQFSTPGYSTQLQVLVSVGMTPDPAKGSLNPYVPIRAAYINITKLACTLRRYVPLIKSGTVTKSGAARRSTPAEGAVTRKAGVTKVDTVYLQGNSSADTVLGEITADIEGLQDDAGGTITALTGGPGANALLENPADITYLLMREQFGEKTTANYQAARWATTRTRLAGAKWAFRYEGGTFSDFRKLAGLQARADLFQDGAKWVFAFRELTAVAQTFTARNTMGEPLMRWTPRTDLVTVVQAHYDWDPHAEVWRHSVEKRSTRHLDRYGVRRKQDTRPGRTLRDLSLPWVRDPTMAAGLAGYWLGQWERPRMVVTLRGAWDALHVDKADILNVDEVDFPWFLPFGNIGFGVRGKKYLLDAGLVELEAVEVDFLPSEILQDAQYWILRTTAKPLAAGYRLFLVRDGTKAGTYRVITVISPTKAAQYFMGITSSPTKAAQFRLFPTISLTRSALYVIATHWDTGIRWDTAGIYWDGAAAPTRTVWDFPVGFGMGGFGQGSPGYAWDRAGIHWDN